MRKPRRSSCQVMMRPGPLTLRMPTVTRLPSAIASAASPVVEKPSQGKLRSCACGRIHIASGLPGKLPRTLSGRLVRAVSGTAKMKLPDGRWAGWRGSESSASMVLICPPSLTKAISMCPAVITTRCEGACLLDDGTGAAVGSAVGAAVGSVVGAVVGAAELGAVLVSGAAVFGARSPVVVPSGRPTVASSPTSQYWVTGSERSVLPSVCSALPCHVSAYTPGLEKVHVKCPWPPTS